jgi:hypothetical protein
MTWSRLPYGLHASLNTYTMYIYTCIEKGYRFWEDMLQVSVKPISLWRLPLLTWKYFSNAVTHMHTHILSRDIVNPQSYLQLLLARMRQTLLEGYHASLWRTLGIPDTGGHTIQFWSHTKVVLRYKLRPVAPLRGPMGRWPLQKSEERLRSRRELGRKYLILQTEESFLIYWWAKSWSVTEMDTFLSRWWGKEHVYRCCKGTIRFQLG